MTATDDLVWKKHPKLRRPILIAAFEGWNDGGEAASIAIAHLAEIWEADSFAEIDAEEYFDFTSTRPEVELVNGDTREIRWPTNEFLVAEIPEASNDVILLVGDEPQLRWKKFCAHIIEVARSCDVSMVVTLGALLADVPHTRPTRISCTSFDAAVNERLSLRPSSYEGPTGIVGVLNDALHREGIPTCAVWAGVPHYLPSTPSPKAALALLEQASVVAGISIPTLALEVATVDYERQINEIIDADEDMVGFLGQLEANYDAGDFGVESDDEDDILEPDARTVFSDTQGKLFTGDALAAELEKYLRDEGR